MIDGKVIQDKAAEDVLASLETGASSQASTVSALVAKVPDAELPTTAGDYKLTVAVDGETVTYSWTAIE